MEGDTSPRKRVYYNVMRKELQEERREHKHKEITKDY